MTLIHPLLLVAAVTAAAPFAVAQATSTVAFDFRNPALDPAHYLLTLHTDGTGHYRSEPGTSAAPDAQGHPAQPFDQAITISAPLRDEFFALAKAHHRFAETCDTGKADKTFTGKKTLSYKSSDGTGSCTFMHASDPEIAHLTAQLIAVADTLQEGRKLRLLYLNDRLGLDAELETLTSDHASGKAIELQNIAPELRTIANDDTLLDRARTRAKALLATVPAPLQP